VASGPTQRTSCHRPQIWTDGRTFHHSAYCPLPRGSRYSTAQESYQSVAMRTHSPGTKVAYLSSGRNKKIRIFGVGQLWSKFEQQSQVDAAVCRQYLSSTVTRGSRWDTLQACIWSLRAVWLRLKRHDSSRWRRV